ncbi:SGNH hydrolase-type esterase domain-containing protein [Artemisia annua]|uniref:SGNH hydrolase-type esterase domain-containing protein n=1 Tax=Artemisia annua TaxID=35608 RepID=A0A2U1M907_ARTAN|nr:SGNH hydrolase-type esterase domain-containing protein [Artemisia annua]
MAHKFSRLVLVHVFIVLMHLEPFVVSEEPQVPCYFIFGDSLVDSGNNNQLVTASKVNYPPYGIDFSEKASGRFTNGRTLADLIGEHLGFDEYIPSYAVATDEQINKGVNYASGSSGIRDETGSHLGERISLNMQLLHHDSIISRLSNLQHDTTFTNKCIYLLNIGSNDYINNYFFSDYYNTSRVYDPTQYAVNLIEQYSEQLMTLYNLGARKIVVFGLARIGCIPAEIGRFGTHGKLCVDPLNEAAKIFNNKLKSLVDDLNNIYSDGRFTFINVTSISAPQGDIPFPNEPCCQVREDWQCTPNTDPCRFRDLSLFFDGFHPTEISNILLAARSYTRLFTTDASPWDIKHLSQL